ncbi:MAG TPA: RibD family protein [Acidobacteriota bacterium]|nr:RibD family protein [Acidobacteriota bacterium]HQF87740.1 RibD family protein [Acidobacteriota bacterium]HQG92456.1 RibD family protein [Acidobacteriota bacterium]HQK87685.1 RibD family protein [Acidobacteriota bacterium]
MSDRNRSTVFCNYAVTLDGKIAAADRSGAGFSSREDRRRMDAVRARADLIVAGAETVRRDDPPFHVRDAALTAAREAAGRSATPDLCVLSRSGRLNPELKIFRQTRYRILVATPASFTAPPGARAEVARLPVTEPPDIRRLLTELAARGYREILVEGGGRVNALFFEAGVVDEVYLTLCPVVLGGAAAPTPVDGAGLPEAVRARCVLRSVDRAGNELFLHYRVKHTPR